MTITTAERQLGLRLRAQRKKLLLTQDELAEKAGLSIQHVGDIERGQANPTFACLCRLAEVMGVDVACFFAESQEREVDAEGMRRTLMSFLQTAKKGQLATFYQLYRGML